MQITILSFFVAFGLIDQVALTSNSIVHVYNVPHNCMPNPCTNTQKYHIITLHLQYIISNSIHGTNNAQTSKMLWDV